jgi:thymidylate synthase (FAD)
MFGKMGSLNPRWVDGSSPERQRGYAQFKGKTFIKSVLERDGYRCKRCGSGKKCKRGLHAHHIKPWAGNKDLRFDVNNAVTLCRPCHHWVHSKANIAKEFIL